jgi:tyrosine-protein kinase Etk/Wzc
MAEKLDNKKIKKQIISPEDLKVIYRIFFKNWQYFILVPSALACLAFFYTHRMTDVYAARTQILLRSTETHNYQDRLYQNIGFMGAYGDITNQKRILSSYDLIQKALDKLDFNISYFIEGRLKTTELYNSMPFKIDIELISSGKKLFEKPIQYEIISAAEYMLKYEINGIRYEQTHKYGEKAFTDHYIVNATKRTELNVNSVDRLSELKYHFVVHSESSLISRIRSSLSIENVDFTSILEIQLTDQIGARAKMFLDTLSKVYI